MKKPSAAPSHRPKVDAHLRERIHEAEAISHASEIRVLPGKDWGHWYGTTPAAAVAQKLLEGKTEPSDKSVQDALRPKALIYKADDVKAYGVDPIIARVRMSSTRATNDDYSRRAHFYAAFFDKEVDVPTLNTVYDDLTFCAVVHEGMENLGATGRDQLQQAMSLQGQKLVAGLKTNSGFGKVLDLLQLKWLNTQGVVSDPEYVRLQSLLDTGEKDLFDYLFPHYEKFSQTRDRKAFERLRDCIVEIVKDKPDEPNPIDDPEKTQVINPDQPGGVPMPPPGGEGDPAIPPEDADEYHTPPPSPSGGGPDEGNDTMKSRPFFVIEARGTSQKPLLGYYCRGHKSYFDKNTLTWSKKKVLGPYTRSVPGDHRFAITGYVTTGITAIPIPDGYELDASKLTVSGGVKVDLLRDQNGCFYAQSSSPVEISVEFVKEDNPFESPPIAQDTESLYTGALSAATEALLASVRGSGAGAEAIALKVQKYLRSNHVYPGGGDLQAAQRVQHQIRSTSNASNYVQNLDAAKHLECYSTAHLAIALLRNLGVPARLVVGDHIDSSKKGKASIDNTTGHAWVVIWNGNRWVRIDPTPPPDPAEKKKKDKKDKQQGKQKEKNDGGEKADDGGMEGDKSGSADSGDESGDPGDESGDQTPGEPGQDSGDGEGEKSDQPGEKPESMEDIVEQLKDRAEQRAREEAQKVDDRDVDDAQKELDNAKKKLDQMEEAKQKMKQKVSEDGTDKSFKDLEKLRENLDKEELLDDMKKEIEEIIDAVEEQKKQELQEKLDKLEEDGFIDEAEKKRMEAELKKDNPQALDRLALEIERDAVLHDQYELIKEEVADVVDQWYEYFVERLPKRVDARIADYAGARRGKLDKKAMGRPIAIQTGKVFRPREWTSSTEPMFLAAFLVDVSDSMDGPVHDEQYRIIEPSKLKAVLKVLIALCELLSRIKKEYGYVRFSIDVFADYMRRIKGFEQDYDSRERYDFGNGAQSTIKARLMQHVYTNGGTEMLPAIGQVAEDLNAQKEQYPEYASAFYFMGDGGDSSGNGPRIRRMLTDARSPWGMEDHMVSAIMLGNQSQFRVLADIFGDDNTTVAPSFNELFRATMENFDQQMEAYIRKMNLG
ncbi:MAG: hypothetical protein HY817_01920 [Candidatus Abawacabacteria bacterium]|nr:hypothetical protein [Candidatus Abawacabacteria bacterium]